MERLLKESWYILGAVERRISKEEAGLQVGMIGNLIFLAYARGVSGNATQNR
jgi:hypothetical protein